MTERIYKVGEIAEMLKINRRAVRQLCDEGRIVAVKIGREYRISESAYQKFIYPDSE
ncbi:helix-turn-helix domain-containing protein [Methanospirillum sp.]